MLRRVIVGMLFVWVMFSLAFGVSIRYWDIHMDQGIGPAAKGVWGIYNNPAVLSLEEQWHFGAFANVAEDSAGMAHSVFGIALLQPFQNGFAGSLDLLYGKLDDPLSHNRFASFGYAVAGKVERLGWGARLVTGFFDNDAENSFYASANFGLLYQLFSSSYVLVNFNAPQIITSNKDLYDINQPETFSGGMGILSTSGSSRAYLGAVTYSDDQNPYFALMMGGGVKMAFLNWDLAMVASNLSLGQQLEDAMVSFKVTGLFDFENFSVGVGGDFPLSGDSFGKNQYHAFVQAKW
ncbi:MAG TPA: hypothetical protein P5560_07075 [Thermotogota bacterium]|nr:hypothetical protein [Thermotogota bacterium]HRW92688.1 hypothetical protein [Thermotogota bacterium]